MSNYTETPWKAGDLAKWEGSEKTRYGILMGDPSSGLVFVQPIGGGIPNLLDVDQLHPCDDDPGYWCADPYIPTGHMTPAFYIVSRGDVQIAECDSDASAQLVAAALNRVRPFAGEANQIGEGESA